MSNCRVKTAMKCGRSSRFTSVIITHDCTVLSRGLNLNRISPLKISSRDLGLISQMPNVHPGPFVHATPITP